MLKFNMHIKNKKAYFEYTVEEQIEAGMVLDASEVKSLRKHTPSLHGHCIIQHGEILIRGLIFQGSHYPERDKKLLLHKKQINKILGKYKGKVILPLELYDNKKGFFKILIGLCFKTKKQDIREKLIQKDLKKQIINL